MEALTKENYFNDIESRYPIAFNRFKDWMIDYKKEVKWNDLFNSNSDYQNYHGKNAPSPEIYDLPYDMQFGIIIRFSSEIVGESQEDMVTKEELGQLFETLMYGITKDIKNTN